MADPARDQILARIRDALAPMAERAAYPDYEPAIAVSAARMGGTGLVETFERNLKAVNGRLMRDVAALAGFLKQNGHLRGYCDPGLMAEVGEGLAAAGLEVEGSFDRSRFEDYAFGVTRATAAIAESGTIAIDDDRTSDRLAALAPWVHVAVLREAEIVPTIAEAVQRLGSSPNIIWCSGPSKTADVEGILIEGVHGPGEEIALLLG